MTAAATILVDTTSAPSLDVLERARALVRDFPECFVWVHPDAEIHSAEHVRIVIENLREYGGHLAWREAQRLYQCL